MLEENKIKNLIITADDFGKSEKANRNILRLAKMGKIGRVSLMTDGYFGFNEIENLVAAGVKVDIHFELDWQKKRRGKLRDNTMKQGIVFLMNHFRSSQRKKIREDWERQIEKFRELVGRYPDGINSHEYVHLFPAYFRIAIDLSSQYNIPFVRFGKKGFGGSRNIAHLALNNLRRWDKKYFSASRLDSSDYFASLDWIRDIDKFIENIPEGKTEIACHPERENEFGLIEKYF